MQVSLSAHIFFDHQSSLLYIHHVFSDRQSSIIQQRSINHHQHGQILRTDRRCPCRHNLRWAHPCSDSHCRASAVASFDCQGTLHESSLSGRCLPLIIRLFPQNVSRVRWTGVPSRSTSSKTAIQWGSTVTSVCRLVIKRGLTMATGHNQPRPTITLSRPGAIRRACLSARTS